MADLILDDPDSRLDFFRQAVLTNILYWQAQLEAKKSKVILTKNHSVVIKAISFGLDLEEAWPPLYELVTTFSPYMERWGHWAIWSQTLGEAIQTAQGLDDLKNAANLSVTLALMSQRQHQFRAAIGHYRKAIRVARQADNQFALARAFTNLGFLFTELGYWLRAEVFCYRALAIFKQIDNRYGWAHTENHLGFLYSRQGRWGQAEDHLKQACALWQADEDHYGLLRGYINFSLLYLKQEVPDQALIYLNKAQYQADAIGDGVEVGVIYANMAIAHRLRGDLEQAEKFNRQAEGVYQQQSNLDGLARVWGNLGLVYIEQRRWKAAASYLAKSLEMRRTLGNKRGEIETLLDFVEYEIARKNNGKAVEWLGEAENLVKTVVVDSQHNPYQRRLEKYRRSLMGDQFNQAAADKLSIDEH